MTDQTVLQLVKKFRKNAGDSAVLVTPELVDVERVPSEIFPLDFATGGGFPLGKFSIVYGPESSGKTNIVLKTMASFQKKHPDKRIVFLDVENSFDPKWAEAMGVDLQDLIVAKPTFGEEAVDWVDQFLRASDIGMVIVDSLAALTPETEAESGADRMQVAGASLLIGKLIRKCNVNLSRAAREGRFPLVILVNQVRFKVGLVFGDPEKQPGGQAVQHASGLTVRTYGKNEVVKEIHSAMPAFKKTSVVLKKWKVPIIAANCEYRMVMLPHSGMPVGYVADNKMLSSQLKELGWLSKKDQGWKLLDREEPFSSEKAALQFIYDDAELEEGLKKSIIQEEIKRLEEGGILLKEFEE